MKKTKIIIPAMGLLLLSTAASITGTVAWFAVNTSVSVTGLQVQAKAEGGIVIAPYALAHGSSIPDGGVGSLTDAEYTPPAANTFTNTAATASPAAELYPTSTADTSAWYHATSNAVDNYAASSAYSVLGSESNETLAADGKYYLGTGADAEHAFRASGQYFLYNKFKVKSTNNDSFSLYVSRITVQASGSTSAALDKSVRIAVKAGEGTVAFFAPNYASDDAETLYYYSGSARTAGNPTKGSNADFATRPQVANNTVNLAGIDLQIWVYYEGEDTNLKTTNAAGLTIDSLTISMNFTTLAA